MNIFITSILAVIVLGAILWRRGRDRRTWTVPAARGLQIAGMVVLSLVALVFLVFGVGEMSGGIEGGAGHLIELLPVVALLILACMRPLEGGLVLFTCGVLSALELSAGMLFLGGAPQLSMSSPALLIIALPQVISGALFFTAGLLGTGRTGVHSH
jgi:hypothetical protein